MEFLLLELLNRLDSVEEIHPEVSDSDVREAMGNAVFFGFIKPDADFVLPDVYAMYTADGNRRVKEALVPYLDAAPSIALTLGITTFHGRLAVFQNDEVKSVGGNYYDDYFGWSNPQQFDKSGNVIRR
ncbi:MAG TPA: hypothetical protein DDY78_17420 [Planctomycetales bacterium]|jgi:hypothetical protein|nr:hypothetical protein [Planctomycetales bacterium]